MYSNTLRVNVEMHRKSSRDKILPDDCVEEEENEDDDNDEFQNLYRDPPEGCVRLRPSNFGLPATIFFEYPKDLKLRRNDISTLEKLGNRKLIFKCYWERICVKNAFFRAGFEKVEDEHPTKRWTAIWSKHQNMQQLKELNCLQKVNHFQASWCIGRKDRLLKTLNAMKRIHGAHFDFHPEGYILPHDRHIFLRQVTTDMNSKRVTKETNLEQSSIWIFKPVAGSCGRGIKVLTATQALAIPKSKKGLIQRYLQNPYLINGKKFDLRIYVLVSGVDPLRVYVHNEGLTRISTSNYSLNNTRNVFAHLTNYSINKKAKNYCVDSVSDADAPPITPMHGENDSEAYKWSLTAFRQWLTQRVGEDVVKLTFQRIDDIIVKTMIAGESEITPRLYEEANYRSNCYELFGCDILLDEALMPSLLEVNISPSLMGSSPLDKRIKGILLADLFHLIGFYPNDPILLKKYQQQSENGLGAVKPQPTSECPFSFISISKALNTQSKWRTNNSSPDNIDLSSIAKDDTCWSLLLSIADEFSRAKATQFHLLHPVEKTSRHYLQLYHTPRFTDHLLTRWILEGGRNRASRSPRQYQTKKKTAGKRVGTPPAASTPCSAEKRCRSLDADCGSAQASVDGQPISTPSGLESQCVTAEDLTALLQRLDFDDTLEKVTTCPAGEGAATPQTETETPHKSRTATRRSRCTDRTRRSTSCEDTRRPQSATSSKIALTPYVLSDPVQPLPADGRVRLFALQGTRYSAGPEARLRSAPAASPLRAHVVPSTLLTLRKS